MKKLGLGLFLLVALLLPTFAQGTAEKTVDLSEPVTLTLWTHEDANRAALEKGLIEEFTKQNPNVSVDYQTYPSGKMSELLTVAFSANQGPDVFNQSQSVIRRFVVEGRTSTLNPTWIGAKSTKEVLDRYIPGSLEAVMLDGGIHGLPLEYTNLCLFVNKQIFREAGLDAEKDYPKTWEEVMSLSEKLVQRNGEIITRRGFDFRYPSYTQQFLPMVEQLGGKLISDDGKKAVIGDAAWIQFFDYMKAWGPKGKNLGGPTYTAARKAFDLNDNQIAMSESGLYQEARIQTANPEFYNSGDWMVVPYPQWENAIQHVAGKVSCHYYLVNGQSSEAKQIWSWRLVDFMLSHGEDYLAKVNLVQPTYKLFKSKAFSETPYSSVFEDDMNYANLVFYAENSGAINDKFKAAVESSMLQGKDSKEVLDSFRASVQDILNEE
ncbi:ABC-type sugar transport system, periplasmic component [Sphaerochaeta pleomorpha str. Grapes]|uniref:ABC-type sugar transport system, periplasmic component n=1 Tax=Sphaerochaeta pleomorpha (strain ATCC BAA-1885 / DSM 22778 / Grapes) TaxID=158190 RepID=G8QRB3_SPHPG|nr:extracellular solute-binding protein [Sphaerochaeta pleomorpha]AEV28766.1 ABC-type sugar transport system, periplasmic component [Sphaerochaeta pleomorpha str. Grapes]